jgi:hypothetical protein
MVAANSIRTAQVPTIAPVEQYGSARASQLFALAPIDNTQSAPYTRVSQTPIIAPVQSEGVTRTSQTYILGVYGVGSTENFKLRAWTFVLDGNYYYVLHLGLQGTWIYCLATDTWAEWQTLGYDNWNAECGLVWNSRIVAGDQANGILWEVDPELMTDEDFRPIERTVTALLPASGRDYVTVDNLFVTASVGYPTSLDPLVALRFSDDYGNTWVDMTDCNVTLLPGAFGQEIAYRSLGGFGAPGRIFEITDTGGAVRIDRADVETSGGS